MKRVLTLLTVAAVAVTLAACEVKKSAKSDVKVVKTEKIIKPVAEKPLTLEDVNRKAINALVRVKKLEDLAKAKGAI